MEAAKGGHTNVVHLLLDWPNSGSLTQGTKSVGASVPTDGFKSTCDTSVAPAAVHLPSCPDAAFRPVQPRSVVTPQLMNTGI